jgi:hypothetical protein
MRTKASTAALRQVCKRLLLRPRAFRAIRLAVHKCQQRKGPENVGAFSPCQEMNWSDLLYFGATGYFGRGGIGL